MFDDTYERLRSHFPPTDLVNADRCATRLAATLQAAGAGPQGKILVAYGGGKDSSYALAFMRVVQLMLRRTHGMTVAMRVITNRHAGMPRAVMENISRVYAALDLIDDPTCELLIVDGETISPFDLDADVPQPLMQRNRLDILMTGHRAAGDGRPTFCNACNLSMVKAFGIAVAHDGGVDVIVTGDSLEEQRAYYLWTARLSRGLGDSGRPSSPGFRRLLQMLNGISQTYFADIHGADRMDPEMHGVPSDIGDGPRFFSIYEDTAYASGDHWDLLTGFLGFVFDDIAFSFSESDCGNPGLMAHLRGLKVEHRYGRHYADGIAEYVSFAVGLMRRKDFPPHLIAAVQARYAGAEGADHMREVMRRYAWETYNLDEDQLICMVWAPFVDNGSALAAYLAAERPGLLPHLAAVHEMLADKGAAPADIESELVAVSGLTIDQLRVLYARPALGAGQDLLTTILAGDPHTSVIATQHRDGPAMEQISGR